MSGEGFDILNELLAHLNEHTQYENSFLSPENQIPEFTTQDVIELVNNRPESLEQIVTELRTQNDSIIGADSANQTVSEYVQTLHDNWQMLPSDYVVSKKDMRGIREYFQGDKLYSELSERQQGMLDALTFEDSDFSVDGMYAFDHDAVKFFSLREQVMHNLNEQNILT